MNPDPCECDDEGNMCDACAKLQETYWAAYFGLCPGMTPTERRAQLDRMDPRPVSDETMDEYRRLK